MGAAEAPLKQQRVIFAELSSLRELKISILSSISCHLNETCNLELYSCLVQNKKFGTWVMLGLRMLKIN